MENTEEGKKKKENEKRQIKNEGEKSLKNENKDLSCKLT